MPKTSQRKRSSARRKPKAKGPDGYWFDDAASDRACQFIETLLKHWKGEWAGQLFRLEPWQRKIIRDVFGWKRLDGTRKYRWVYVEVPKKNGKSFLLAAVALLLLFLDNEPGAEIYSAAADRKQAALVFQDAKMMVQQSDPLKARGKSYARRIICHKSNSFYEALSADAPTKHGFNPHGIMFDELHVQPNRELWDTLVLGIAARRQPLVFSITTAGVYDPDSICWEQHAYADKVIRGVIDDPSFYGVIYAADKDDDWASPETAKKANPCYGVTVKPDYLASMVSQALDVPAKADAYKRLHLNIWTSARSRALPAEVWDRNNAPVEIEDGDDCYIGIDLSSKLDLTAAVALFPRTMSILPFSWIPEENMKSRMERDRVPYHLWAEQGLITPTGGNVVDQRAIRNKIVELGERYNILEIGFDSWNASEMARWLSDEDGFNLVEMRQGYKTMSEPFKAIVGEALDGKYKHGGHPVLRWNIDNLTARKDPNDNWAPMKESTSNRIDLAVALIMARGRMMLAEQQTAPSIWSVG